MYDHEVQERSVKNTTMNTRMPIQCTKVRDWELQKKYLTGRRLNPGLAEMNGWYPSNDFKGGTRIVIPARSDRSGHAYYQARAMDRNPLRYVSPPGPRYGALIHVSCDHAASSKFLVVVEGPMDALAVAGEGVDCVATMGIVPGSLAVVHLTILAESRPVIVMFDNEPEAQAASVEIVGLLCSRGIMADRPPVKLTAKDFCAASNKERHSVIMEIRKWASRLG